MSREYYQQQQNTVHSSINQMNNMNNKYYKPDYSKHYAYRSPKSNNMNIQTNNGYNYNKNNNYFPSNSKNHTSNNNNNYTSPGASYPKPFYSQPTHFQQPLYNSSFDYTTIVTQLKLSLHKSIQSQSILQSQLHTQKSRSYQLLQLNHKLTQQLSKMQFQFDRINQKEKLSMKELLIKYQTMQNQNVKINIKNNQLYDEIKKLRKQNRELMTYGNKMEKELEISLQDNKCLLEKVKQLENQLRRINNQLNQLQQRQKYHYQQYNQNNHQHNQHNQQNNNNQVFNSIITTRTNNIQSQYRTNLPSHHLNNPNKISHKHLSPYSKPYKLNEYNSNYRNNKNEIDYQIQNSKLLEQYNNLAIENQSMKKLYKEFYSQNNNYQNKRSKHYRSISQENSEYQTEVNHNNNNNHKSYNNNNHKSNKKLNNNNNKNRIQIQNQQHQQYQQNNIKYEQQKLATFQKQQLACQINSLRQQVITNILSKYYFKTINQSSKNNKNCLVVFIKQITKNLQLLDKMIINYLMARDIYKQQLGIKRLQQGKPENQVEKQLDVMFDKVKSKLKGDLKKQQQDCINSQTVTLNINAYYLAIFRLLTLISKHTNNLQSEYINKLKHYCLKYIHKIKEQTQKLRNIQENNNGVNNFKNNNIKYSLNGNNKN